MSTNNSQDLANDPRLTAYALGELETSERVELERLLAVDPAAQRIVEEVRGTARLLETELATELGGGATPGLRPEQRAAVLLGSRAARRLPREQRIRVRQWVAIAAAATFLAWTGLFLAGSPDGVPETDERTASAPKPTTAGARVGVQLSAGDRFLMGNGNEPAEGADTARVQLRYAFEQAPAGTPLDPSKASGALRGLGYIGGEQEGDVEGILRVPSSEHLAFEAQTFEAKGRDPNSVEKQLQALGYAGNVEFEIGTAANSPEMPNFRAFSTGGRVSRFTELAEEPPIADYKNGAIPEWSGQHMYDRERQLIVPRPVTPFLSATRDDFRFRVPGNESYTPIRENGFVSAAQTPLSTFSIDVDTASYSNVRRFLTNHQPPPPDAVRIEELVNYFPYDYPAPEGERPFAVHVEVGSAPWATEHRLVRIGLQGRPPVDAERRISNLVFLLDVSGSMKPANKLPLVKDSLRLMAAHLREGDSVAIVTYAGTTGLWLPATHGEDRATIREAIDRLRAGGSTNGSGGLQLAYRIAREQYVQGGINRVLLATDGDFNVGITSDHELERLIAEQAGSGVFLTVLGFGDGNLKDSKLEILSGRGDGNYAYIDSLREARKVLVDELGGTLETIAKDVKLQVDFNPGRVQAYRLIGYENRALAARDFADDTKDAGEIGAGHSVTALYEVVPSGLVHAAGVEPSKYVSRSEPEPRPDPASISEELLTVRLRYKLPEADESTRFDVPVVDAGLEFLELSDDTRFAASVAAFGMLLRRSSFSGSATLEGLSSWALESLGEDPGGWRAEFCDLVGRARNLGR